MVWNPICLSLLLSTTENIKKEGIETCPPEDLIFDRSVVSSSVTEDYNLVCDQQIIRTIFNSLYLLGMLFGSFFFGMLSDQFGRLKALILSIFAMGASGAIGKSKF